MSVGWRLLLWGYRQKSAPDLMEVNGKAERLESLNGRDVREKTGGPLKLFSWTISLSGEDNVRWSVRRAYSW